jgi:hypothetical protein
MLTDAQLQAIPWRSAARIDLGLFSIDVRSTDAEIPGSRFFRRSALGLSKNPEGLRPGPGSFLLSLVDSGSLAPGQLSALREVKADSYRAKRFRMGYYITDHFGPPHFLLNRDREYVVIGDSFDKIVWPYFVKFFLSAYAAENEMVHLKGSVFALNGCASLLVGRGGSGKSVFLSEFCRRGGKYVSNTHVLYRGGWAYGVPSAIRVRNDGIFGKVIREHRLSEGILADEYVVDPIEHLGWGAASKAQIRNVCIVNYRPDQPEEFRYASREEAIAYLDQFALALNVYGLKEDIFDFVGARLKDFSAVLARDRLAVSGLAEAGRVFYANVDVLNDTTYERISQALAS